MKKGDKEFLKEHCKNVYRKENITGGIFNLFYMTEQEMKEELGIEKEQIQVVENLEEVKQYIEENQLIPEGIDYIFGIEGLDYLEKIEDIDKLYALGLRSANPVWNNENRFGGGVRANKHVGLTKLGEELIEKLVQKGIAMDVSHANEATFWNMIQVCRRLKREGKDPVIFASHSNAKSICDVERNLTDEQIMAIKELGGVIGMVSIKKFCVNTTNIGNETIDFEKGYIEQIAYLKNLLGGVEHIAVATDDMRYYDIEPEYYQNMNIYKLSEVKERLRNALLKHHFQEEEIEKILERNVKEKIFARVLQKEGAK